MDIAEELARIGLQEERLRFTRFDASVAWSLGIALRGAALERAAPVAIDISTHAQPLFYHALEGAVPDNADWIRRKRNVTLRFFRSSYALGLELQRDARTLRERFGLRDADFMAHGGSFPIRIAGSGCVGAVTVSGLPQRDDHDLVTRVMAAFLGVAVDEITLSATAKP